MICRGLDRGNGWAGLGLCGESGRGGKGGKGLCHIGLEEGDEMLGGRYSGFRAYKCFSCWLWTYTIPYRTARPPQNLSNWKSRI